MIEQGVDICIRSGSLDESSMIARQLSPMDFITCASPGYLDTLRASSRSGTKSTPLITEDSYANHPWIRFRFKQTGKLMPILTNSTAQAITQGPGEDFVVDDGEAMALLCAQDLGLTQMPHFLARDWLRDGSLIPVSPYVRAKQFGVWMIYAQRQFQPAKIRVFLNYISEKLEAQGETQFRTWAESLTLFEVQNSL
jgi:DNA-binding transcriptional LysR family regulator